MRNKEINIRIPNDYIEPIFVKNLGNAIWLLLWVINRCTQSIDRLGVVLGGQPLTNEMIGKELGYSTVQVGRMVRQLVKHGFIYTLTVHGGLRIFFVVGITKFKYLPTIPKVLKLLQRTREDILSSSYYNKLRKQPDASPGLKKLFDDFKEHADQKLNNGVLSANSGVSKLIPPSIKNAPPNKETLIDTSKETELDNKKEIKEHADHSGKDIFQVFNAYMRAIGSNREKIQDEEAILIDKAIEYEGVDNLLTAIKKYSQEVNKRKNWSFVPVTKFFNIDFYTRFFNIPGGNSLEVDYVPRGGWEPE